jgi:anti-sigma factor RsiW
MKTETMLEIQAYADGELDAARRADVERLVRDDAQAADLQTELLAVGQAVRTHEPAGTVPETREFYWSQLQRRIAAEESAANRPAQPGALRNWLRWLAPALGVAALALIFTMRSGPAATLADASVMTFRSDNDGLTIHWIN